MKVKDVMSTPPVTCRTSSSLADAASEMWRNDCGALPVVNDNGVAVGMITDRDICIAVGTREQKAAEIPVQSVITGHLTYVHPDDELSEVFTSMERERVHRLPVLDDQAHVVGVVSINDLVMRAGEAERDRALATGHVISTIRQISTHWLPTAPKHSTVLDATPFDATLVDASPVDPNQVEAAPGDRTTNPTTRLRSRNTRGGRKA